MEETSFPSSLVSGKDTSLGLLWEAAMGSELPTEFATESQMAEEDDKFHSFSPRRDIQFLKYSANRPDVAASPAGIPLLSMASKMICMSVST